MDEASRSPTRPPSVGLASHVAAFAIALVVTATSKPGQEAVLAVLLALVALGGILALSRPDHRLGPDLIRIARSVFLGWLVVFRFPS